jgi:hypothetical protein
MDISQRRSDDARPVGQSSVGPKPAAALHSRVKPSHVLDLRSDASLGSESGNIALGAPVVHAPTRTPAAQPRSTAQERHIARFTDRFDHARKYSRSSQIAHFGTDVFGNIQDPHKMYDKFGNPTLNTLTHGATEVRYGPHGQAEGHPPAAGLTMPNQAVTHHEAMSRLVPAAPLPSASTATSAPPAPSTWLPHLRLPRPGSRTLTTLAAISIMAGYIWFQNYPKLAIESAGNRAGISATLPTYLPSSYNLSRTDTGPGLVTLSFNSPSLPDTLKISQHRTSWDSSSLLDNFVAKQTDDYAAVQDQGLTIYLFNNNKATWVNHGIWYSIEGAARLSREQVLNIAYSL